MTVAELIEELKKYPQDMEICSHGQDWGGTDGYSPVVYERDGSLYVDG